MLWRPLFQSPTLQFSPLRQPAGALEAFDLMREHALELTEVEFRLAITALCGSQRLDDAMCVGLGDTHRDVACVA